MDPPYNNTGCKLTYPTMNDEIWMNSINFNNIIDDGFIFIWVTNAKAFKITSLMAAKGWRECENVAWNKFDKSGKPLFRGGYDMMHIHETCLVFKRKASINKSERF